MAHAVKVKGLRELNRAFARADKTLKTEKDDALKKAAEPVRADAERLAVAHIRKVGLNWSRMRVGTTQRVVYVAPRARSTRQVNRKRPKFGTKLMAEAMEPALEQNRANVIREMERFMDEIGRDWAR